RTAERRAPRQDPVEDRAESVDVGATGHAAPGVRLLGGHELARPDDAPALGQRARQEVLGDPEVAQARLARVVEEGLRRLGVAADDPRRVREVGRARDRDQERERALSSEAGVESGRESPAAEEVHDDERPRAVVADLAETDDPAVVAEELEHPALAAEALAVL